MNKKTRFDRWTRRQSLSDEREDQFWEDEWEDQMREDEHEDKMWGDDQEDKIWGRKEKKTRFEGGSRRQQKEIPA